MKKVLLSLSLLASVAVSAAWTPVEFGLCGRMALPWCERVYGFKGAFVGHNATSVYGLDLSCLGRSRDVRGVGADALASLDEAVRGITVAGGCGWNDDVRGVQLAGLVAWSKEIYGAQCAGFFTWTDRANGLQFGCFNVASELQGVQIGILNSCQRLEGLQIGLLNYHRISPLHSVLPVMNVGW